jgi:hypothetical protein
VFVQFLQKLLREGLVRFSIRPSSDHEDDSSAVRLLEDAYCSYRLQVAGPLLAFDPAIALAAGRLVQWACWFLVSRSEPESEVTKRLLMSAQPSLPTHHLSADLLFRYLPQVHRRAQALYPADPLPQLLAKLLREWPLSGVLSQVEEGPVDTRLEFGGHSGLIMLYAERLARHEKPAWFPIGAATESVELVWQEMGKDTAALRRLATVP